MKFTIPQQGGDVAKLLFQYQSHTIKSDKFLNCSVIPKSSLLSQPEGLDRTEGTYHLLCISSVCQIYSVCLGISEDIICCRPANFLIDENLNKSS
jgi:hypothetical protein